MAVLGTGAIFGYGHLGGYPPGAVGACLAGVYGCALGWLRMRTGGWGLGFLTHIVADAAIFGILVWAGGFG